VPFEQAAAAGAAAYTALRGLRDAGRIQPGQHVLINGASGGVGTFAVQIARSYGAIVTGVCSTRNLDLARSIGADHVIDYTRDDFAQGGHRYDLIFDVVAKRSFPECTHALNPNGTYVTTEYSPILALKALWTSTISVKKMVPLLGKPPSEGDQALIRDLLAAGKVVPVIDREFPLSEVVAGLRYLIEGHARRKIIITV
jgi:NADPH:quinone reductase-like Zn-dependent oxidoreductase